MAHTGHVLTDLDHEWLTINTSPDSLRTLRRWQAEHPWLGGVDDFDGLIARIRGTDPETSIEVVWALLTLAVDDQLARRVLLQTIIPGLGGELAWLLRWSQRVDPTMLDLGDIDQLLIVSAMEAIAHAAGQRKAWPVLSILRRAHRLLVRATRVEERWQAATVYGDPPKEAAGWRTSTRLQID